ncbi:MAG: cyclic nucleotide-binding domain-containing protein [Ignavibacteriales bacterium]|jgi:CRP-like cAMP-binding protein|nr:cyclic nucleotide-binding domain-containing protein [Ignavibacteriales bacterium]MBP7542237.1 cyclic nucleotide-binding domain-containing protein [Ignavibacteriaceae bacterium]MBK7266816.1 cyclic nucleotide-binding domain-containing protein [Ignavibacteriales bacterium]MBK8660571.1 cyclic nucleotide-binding domain-containing protein [Ignavibacteriales bacterium]MBP9122775.1 cyclic nucleotide-binding domain-containing protein [Ignavibacteriaceae bacterium]
MKIFKPGDVITREGAVDKELFILISGRIGVFKSEVKVAEFSEKGMVIGEMSIILEGERTASLIAEEETVVLNLNLPMDKLIEKYPDLVKKMMVNLAERLQVLTQEYYVLAKGISPDQMNNGEPQ